jgi:uncharacterized membrane protein
MTADQVWADSLPPPGPPCSAPASQERAYWDAVNADHHLAAQMFLVLAVAGGISSVAATIALRGWWRAGYAVLAVVGLVLSLFGLVAVGLTSGDRICP